MEPHNNNGGLNNERRPIPATMRGTERSELPPPPPPAKKTLAREEQERDMLFWLQLTPEVRATYMGMAYRPAMHEGEILRQAVKFARQAEMPSVSDF